jgi:hypothetical protein
MLNGTYADVEVLYAERCYAECHYAECRGALKSAEARTLVDFKWGANNIFMNAMKI